LLRNNHNKLLQMNETRCCGRAASCKHFVNGMSALYCR
jgi:hypothetical protein